MILQKNNFGLQGQSVFLNYDDDYDHLFKKFKEKRAIKKEDKKDSRDEKKERKTARKDEKQDKRELGTEKKRLKNEMKQTQIDEKKAQLALLTQQSQLPPPSAPGPGAGDNSTIIVISLVGVVALSIVGWMAYRKQNPDPSMRLQAA